MIEAKSREKKVLGVNDISNTVNAALNLLQAQAINSAVIVSSHGFTPEARSTTLNRPNIQLTTLHELQQQLFNSSESLLRSLRDFSSNEVTSEYIPLSAKSHSGGKSVDDIASHIIYNCKVGGSLLILLGDFGSGKTTVLEKAFVECANLRLLDPTAKFPVFLRLRSLRQHADLWSFISASLRDNQYIMPPKHVFDHQLGTGKFVIFLDGFDEILASANLEDRAGFLTTLYPLLDTMSPCVLSSRPTYFSSPQEMLKLLGLRLGRAKVVDRTPEDARTRIALAKLRRSMKLGNERRVTSDLFAEVWTIDQLSEEAVLDYLKQQESALQGKTGKNAIEIRRVLDRVYDLKDLMRRPLLLTMVVRTILDGVVDIDKPDLAIGPSTLYEAYTQLSFERDEKRGAGSLSADARRIVCQHLSLSMAKNGSVELSQDEVRQCILESGVDSEGALPVGPRSQAFDGRRVRQQPLSEAVIESVLTDIRLGTFLSFGRDGTLRFAHKSYLEFFVAQFIFQSALDNPDALSRVGNVPIDREVVYFLGSYTRESESFAKWIARRKDTGPQDFPMSRQDAMRVMFASGNLLSGSTISNATIADVEMRRAQITDTRFEDLAIRSVVVSELSVRGLTARRTVLENCEINLVDYTNCDVDFDAREASFLNLKYQGGSFAVRGQGWKVDASHFKGANVRFAGSGIIGSARFESCNLQMVCDFARELRFECLGSTLTCRWDGDSLSLDRVSIRNCKIFGLVLRVEDVLSLVPAPGASSRAAISGGAIDGSSQGVVFVDTRSTDSSAMRAWAGAQSGLNAALPRVRFFDLQLFRQAIQVPSGKRLSSIRRTNVVEQSGESDGSKEPLKQAGEDAIKMMRRLTAEMLEHSWMDDQGAAPLVAELKAGGFL